MNERNAEIKNYICKHFTREDQDLRTVKELAQKEGIPDIGISPDIGKIVHMLTKFHNPKTILEIGTLAGSSTVWLAKAAPNAKITTLEYNPHFARVAQNNFKALSLDNQITLVEGDAVVSLEKLVQEKAEPFDLIFLDAHNEGYPDMLPYLLKLSKPGTMLLTDNLIPKEGEIGHPEEHEIESVKTYEYNALLANLPHVDTVLIPTIVGGKGRTDALGISLFSSGFKTLP